MKGGLGKGMRRREVEGLGAGACCVEGRGEGLDEKG